MSLQQIAQTLHGEAAAGGIVALNDDLLGSGSAFAQAVQSALLRAAGNILLTADPRDIPTTASGPSFSFQAGLPTAAGDAFLGLGGNFVTVTIEQVGDIAQVVLSIALTQLATGATTPWSFSQSFPALLGWHFDALPLSAPTLAFVFAPAAPPPGLRPGLNFSSAIALTGMLSPLAQLLQVLGCEPTLAPLSGVIQQFPPGPVFNLEASLGLPALDLLALVVQEPCIGASMNWVRPSDSEMDYEPSGAVFLGAVTELPDLNGVSVPLRVVTALTPDAQATTLSLTIAPASATATTIDNLGQWMAGQSWNQFFSQPPADQLLPLLQVFGLRGYSVTASLQNLSILSSNLSVGTLAPWVIVPDRLVMESFSVSWLLLDPFRAALNSVALDGTLKMIASATQEVTFRGSILLPELQLTFAMVSSPDMTAADWLQTILSAFGGPQLPGFLTDALDYFILQGTTLFMDVPQQQMVYTLAGELRIGERSVGFEVYLKIGLSPSFTYDIRAAFLLGGLRLEGQISNANGKTVISAAWSDAENPVSFNSIAAGLGYPDLGVPPQLDLMLRSMSVVYDFTSSIFIVAADSANYGKSDLVIFQPTGAASYVFFFGLNVDKPIDLTNLPLVGQALSVLQTVELRDLKTLISSAVVSKAQADQLNRLISSKLGAGYPQLPAEGMASTVDLSMVLDIGGYTVPLGVGAGGTSATSMPAAQSSIQGNGAGNTAAMVPTTPGAQSDGTTWFNVHKALGPVTFRRIGVKYEDAVLWFRLDASFSAGGLAIDLLGMSVGSPLSSFEPQFSLEGLGVDLNTSGLRIAGALMKVPPGPGVDWQYAGGIAVKAASFALSALGSYASMSGRPSMFLFGQVTGTFGGPPAFFVTGFAGGFGYNTALRLPKFDELYKFPLVAGAADPAAIGGSGASPAKVLSVLLGLDGGEAWLTPELGQYWLAVGLQFTSYELVKTNALALATFGNRFQLALLGLARARFPPVGPAYAAIELQIQTVFDPQEGIFSLAASLSPNSFLFDPACKLTGGFAFFMWFSPSSHAGDFVITLGGYHPSFDPPSWYPEVPRVGFSWSLGSTVSIAGSAYCALTPSAIMAGGQLGITYHSGNLTAWLKAWANLIIAWNPFHFAAEMGVSVGARYRLNLLFTTKTIEAEFGATLRLWGPPTGGTVTVHWWILSFTIDFGDQAGADAFAKPTPLTWGQFQAQLPPANQQVKIVPTDGLLANGSTDLNDPRTPWAVRPSGFAFTTIAAIPSSSLVLGAAGQVLESGQPLNIRPMQVFNQKSVQTLRITKDGQELDLRASGWTVKPNTQNGPKALWGAGKQNQLDPGDAQLVPGQLVGFVVTAPAPTLGPTLGEIDVAKNLGVDLLTPIGALPVRSDQLPQGPQPTADDRAIAIIAQQISDQPRRDARNALYQSLMALGVDPGTNDDMTSFARAAGGLFADEPLLVHG